MRPSARSGSARTRAAVALVASAIALATPPALVVSSLWVLAHDWFVRFEYGRPGFPADAYGLAREQRTALALTGLRSIQPGTAGVELLRRARLPDGTPAFNARELRHMEDVRRLFGQALRAELAVLVVLVVLAALLARTRARRAVPLGLMLGSLATLAVAALAAPVLLLGFEGFFVRFHELFFTGRSWQFAYSDTLLRLYPELFWRHTAQLVAALVLAQAVAVGLLSWLWWRRVRGAR